MIYELRNYHAVPGRLPALLARFQNRTLPIWKRPGIRQAGFWTTLIGESNQQLTYMLAWDRLAERDKRWGEFLDFVPGMDAAAYTEQDSQHVQDISNEELAPTSFSKMQ